MSFFFVHQTSRFLSSLSIYMMERKGERESHAEIRKGKRDGKGVIPGTLRAARAILPKGESRVKLRLGERSSTQEVVAGRGTRR